MYYKVKLKEGHSATENQVTSDGQYLRLFGLDVPYLYDIKGAKNKARLFGGTPELAVESQAIKNGTVSVVDMTAIDSHVKKLLVGFRTNSMFEVNLMREIFRTILESQREPKLNYFMQMIETDYIILKT